MKAILENGTVMYLHGADIKEITVSIHDDLIVIVLYSGGVLLAKSLTAKDK